MISEGSCDTEVMLLKIQPFLSQEWIQFDHIFKQKADILNWNNIYNIAIFTVLLIKIDADMLSTRQLFQQHKKKLLLTPAFEL